jgi:hypothetical protein
MIARSFPEPGQADDAAILREFIDYQIQFVEQKSAWNKHPVCPFARQGRQSGRIRYQVLPFSETACLEPEGEFQRLVREFAAQSHQLVILFIHPDRRAMSYPALEQLIDVRLAPLLNSLDLEAFSGHPEHPLQIDGVYLRREPFITMQLIRQRVSHRATKGLTRRDYFAGWTADALQYASSHSSGYAQPGG